MPDLFTGGMSHEISVDLPPGRHGMTPQVTFQYRSGNGNGFLGVGWELQLGSVERSLKGGADFAGDGYVLRFDGGSSDLVYGAIDTGVYREYRSKIENDFKRIRRLTATDGRPSFEVTDRNGTRYLYGQSAASRQDTPGNASRIFKWCLDYVVDIHGNSYSIAYFKDRGDIYPASLSYGGTTVTLWRETRTDAPQLFTVQIGVTTAFRLKSVDVRANGRLVRAYRMTYSNSQLSGRSELASVEQYGADAAVDAGGTITGSTSLPKTTFAWTGAKGFADGGLWPHGALDWASVDSMFQEHTWAVDVTGDGKTDMLFGADEAGNWYVLESSGSTFIDRGAWITGAYGDSGYWVSDPLNGDYYQTVPGLGRSTYKVHPVDVNGDGKIDVVLGPDYEGNWFMLESTGSGFIDRGRVLTGFAGGAWSVQDAQYRIRFIDVTGDGMTDIVVGPDGAGNWYVARSTGSAFVNDGIWLTGFMGSPWDSAVNQARIRTMDVNGDGLMDLVVGPDNLGRWYVARSTGYSFVNVGTWLTGFAGAPWDGNANQARIRSMDVNGDGMADLVVGPDGGGNWYVAISTGAAFVNKGIWLSGFAGAPWDRNENQARVRATDVNGDGMTDIVVGPDGAGNWSVARSTGASFVNDGVWLSGFGIGWDYNWMQGSVRLVDVNGDGRPDVTLGPDAGGWHTMLSKAPIPDLLASISNGIGGTTSITYTPSTTYVNTQLPFALPVVSSVSTNDGNGTAATTSYSYYDGYFHTANREFRGFGGVDVSGPAGPNGERVYTQTWFHQGNEIDPWVNVPQGEVGYMKGKPYATRTFDAKTWASFSQSETWYTGDTSSPHFNPVAEVKESFNEYIAGTWVPGRTTKTAYQYDAYGNVTREDQHGDLAVASDDRTVIRSVSANVTNWILGAASSEKVYKGVGVPSPVQSDLIGSTSFYYDGSTNLADCSSTGSSQTPSRGLPTKIIRWLDGGANPEAWIGYDSNGNVVCSSDPDRRLTAFAYDPSGVFRTSVTNALNHQLTTEYFGVNGVAAYGDAACPTAGLACGLYGQVKSKTDPNQAKVSYLYDLFGRRTRETLPDGSFNATAYYLGGVGMNASRVEATTSAGAWSASYLDGLGREYWTRKKGSFLGRILATVTRYNPTGTVRQTSMPYVDTTGLVPADTSPSLRWTRFAYDSMGRALSRSMPDNTRTLACYRDLDGSSVSIDANNHRRREVRDVQGNRVRVQEYTGAFATCATDAGTPYATTNYEYDSLNRLTAVVDAANTRFETAYDTLGRKISLSDPDLGNWSYGYYPSGDLWWQQDAKGARVYFYYDAIHRVLTRHYPAGSDVTFNYDGPQAANSKGRLTQMADGSGVTSYEYDLLGRNTVRAQTIDGIWYTTRRDFDAAGRLSKVTYPDNALPADTSIAAYQYDADGFLCKVSRTMSDTGCARTAASYATFSYSPANALGQVATTSFGNSTSTQYGYYDATSNRLQRITTSGPTGTLLNIGYSYDNLGNVSAMSDELNPTYTQSFGYDELNRLTSASSAAYGTLGYSYNAIGNILTKEGVSYTQYDPIKVHAVRATSDGKSFAYDSNGNMTAEFGSTARTISYDFDNRPVAITRNGATTLLSYDGLGNRVKKQSLSASTRYVSKLFECTGGSCTKHIFAGDQRLASVTASTTSYFHADHLGSTRVVTNQDGVPIEKITYRPFGEALTDSAAGASKHKFTGQEFDPEIGLYFYNARYYNPSLGRFVSGDTVVSSPFLSQTLNRYSYVGNNPINRIDPTGHEFLSIVSFIGAAICGGSVVCGVVAAAVAVVAIAATIDAKSKGYGSPLDKGYLGDIKSGARSAGDRIGARASQFGNWSKNLFGGGGGTDNHYAPGPLGGAVAARAVFAVDGGRVIKAACDGEGYGCQVVIRTGATTIQRYGHLEPGSILPYTPLRGYQGEGVTISVGQDVEAGQQIALYADPTNGKSDGPHVHFEQRDEPTPGFLYGTPQSNERSPLGPNGRMTHPLWELRGMRKDGSPILHPGYDWSY